MISRPLAFLLCLAGAACGLAPVAPPGQAWARSGPESFAPIVRRVLPAVVTISITEPSDASDDDPFADLPPSLQRQFRHQRREEQGAGAGYIIDPSGVIVTNDHVVGKADHIVVALADGTELPARLIGADRLTDVAVIKVNAPRPLPYVTFGDSHSVEVGDWVIVAGNPFALGGSVTAGIVSARGRDIGEGPFDNFIQIDAPINPGNSGGPVFDEDGVVVGMTTAIASPTGGSVGIGFAIPAESVDRIVTELRRSGRIERGWLGVSVHDIEDGDLKAVGVAAVDRRGPAARAGIKPGDIVTAVDGAAVETSNSLIKAIAGIAPGNNVRLTVLRGGREVRVDVAVGRRPDEQG
jgi:serine protease Do